MRDLFPQRSKRAHQLSLGASFSRRTARCIACGHEFGELDLDCSACGAFLCTQCDCMTSPNGGDGRTCYGCLQGRAASG